MRKFSLFRGLTSNLPSTKLCKYHSEKSYINQIYYKYAKIHIFPGLHYGIKKNDQRRYKYTVLRRDKYNFGEKKTLVRTKKFYEINIITITQVFFTKNIFVIFDRYVFFSPTESTTNCPSVLADLFLYSYEVDLSQKRFKKDDKKTTRCFNFTFR